VQLPLDPFADHPDPAWYVAREASDAALEDLLGCAGRPDLPAALRAPPGAGKTLLLRMLASRLGPALHGVYVPNPVLTPAELCAWTLGCLGSPVWQDPIAVLGAYVDHLGECGEALVWLVDDAEGLPEETARWLGQVRPRARGALRLVIAAGPGEPPRAFAALGPMVRIDALAQPMQPAETARYVQGRLERAQAEPELRARCEAVVAAIHAESAGIPRAVSALLSQHVAARDAGQGERSDPGARRSR